MVDYKVTNFKLVRRLGSGAFGEAFLGVNLKTNQEVAIKFEKIDAKLPQLNFEAKLYQYLLTDATAADKGIPRVHYNATEGDHNVMVMDLLGPSLEDLFTGCNRKFTLKTVLMLGIQMLERLEFVHSKAILHRDIKPDNFLIGHGQQKNKVFIIDFGLSKKFINKDGAHIPLREGKSMTGTARYASINTHNGIEQSRRDDLESLGYVLMYLLRGSLPWQNTKASSQREKYEKIKEIKINTTVENLCKGFPNEFVTYLYYCRNLKFDEKPDFRFLKNLFCDLFTKSGFEWDYVYDWNVNRKKKEKSGKDQEEGKKNSSGDSDSQPRTTEATPKGGKGEKATW